MVIKQSYRNHSAKHKRVVERKTRINAAVMRGTNVFNYTHKGTPSNVHLELGRRTLKLLRKFHMTHPSDLNRVPTNRLERKLLNKQRKALFTYILSGHTIPINIFKTHTG